MAVLKAATSTPHSRHSLSVRRVRSTCSSVRAPSKTVYSAPLQYRFDFVTSRMLRIGVVLSFLALATGRTGAKARPYESLAFASADDIWSGAQPMPVETRSTSPWLPLNSNLKTGGSALVTLLDMYAKHLLRNQPDIYRITPENQRLQQHTSNADKIKLVRITEDLSPSGVHLSARLPPSHAGNERARDEINFGEDDHLNSRLPVFPSVPDALGLSSKISNGSLLNVTAFQTLDQQAPRNCFQSGPSSYCEDVQDYPIETIRRLLANEVSGITKLFSPLELKPPAPKPFAKQPVSSPTSMAMAHEGAVIHTRVKPLASAPAAAADVSFGFEEDYSLCGAMRTDTFPKAAKSVDGDWLTIVNQDNIRQAISVEKCNAAEKPCKFARNFPAGFMAVCKQKYMRHRLTVFKNNEIKQDTFLFPSCCVCEVRPMGAI